MNFYCVIYVYIRICNVELFCLDVFDRTNSSVPSFLLGTQAQRENLGREEINELRNFFSLQISLHTNIFFVHLFPENISGDFALKILNIFVSIAVRGRLWSV